MCPAHRSQPWFIRFTISVSLYVYLVQFEVHATPPDTVFQFTAEFAALYVQKLQRFSDQLLSTFAFHGRVKRPKESVLQRESSHLTATSYSAVCTLYSRNLSRIGWIRQGLHENPTDIDLAIGLSLLKRILDNILYAELRSVTPL